MTGENTQPDNPAPRPKQTSREEMRYILTIENGTLRGAPSRVNDLITRRTALRQKARGERRTKGAVLGDTETDLNQELQKYGFSFDDVDKQVAAYTLPPLTEVVAKDAKIDARKLNHFAHASRVARVINERVLPGLQPSDIRPLSDGRLTFSSIPDLAFASDKMLLACLTAQDDRVLYYPHLDGSGKITETSTFEVTPQQRYIIERKAREELAKRGVLDKLAPQKVAMHRLYGMFTVDQDKTGHVSYKNSKGDIVFDFPNGLLNFPLTQATTMDIMYTASTDTFAAYTPVGKAFIIGKSFYERLAAPPTPEKVTGKDIAYIVARHELNHGIWDEVGADSKKQIMDNFTLTNSLFRRFVATLTANPTYRDAAIRDLQWDPTQEVVEYGGVKLGKDRIVNELLAYATWQEIVPRDTITKMREQVGPHGQIDQSVELTFKTAADCLEVAPSALKEFLRQQDLMMMKDSPRFKEFINGFEEAIALLKPHR